MILTTSCQCRACRLGRNTERLANIKTPPYLLDGEDEEALAKVSVALPTFGRMKS